ncbi:MAG TPA: gfo/Idh/MocA family oxidoreductase, partial [Planctomycetaceae bacterium]|nr:gfo/Idh/MocA family oxidoreductase [Planctomycetaceae bacterium]
VHEMDVARWAIKGATLPKRIFSIGGRYIPGEKDQGETPNMQVSVYDYGETILLFETRGLVGKGNAPDRNVSNEFYTSEGVIKGWKFYPKSGGEAVPVEGEEATVTAGGAFGSFINAVRSRKPEDINCDAAAGHYSSALCHLGNISYRLGQESSFDTKSDAFADNDTVGDSIEMLRDNLEAVNIKLADTTYMVGRDLKFNPETEQFDGDDDANALLTRNYRKPFVVPEKV